MEISNKFTKPGPVYYSTEKVLDMFAYMESLDLDYSNLKDLIGAYGVASGRTTKFIDVSTIIPDRELILVKNSLIRVEDYRSKNVEISEEVKNAIASLEPLLSSENLTWEDLENLKEKFPITLKASLTNFHFKKYFPAKLYLRKQIESLKEYSSEILYVNNSLDQGIEFIKDNLEDLLGGTVVLATTEQKLAYLYLFITSMLALSYTRFDNFTLEEIEDVFINTIKSIDL